MKAKVLSVGAVMVTLTRVTLGAPEFAGAKLQARQSIDFDLVDSVPDPVIQPNDVSNFDPAAAIASVIAEVKAGGPLSERKRALESRDILVSTYPGYTDNTPLGNGLLRRAGPVGAPGGAPDPGARHPPRGH